jgi:hypothetical protein
MRLTSRHKKPLERLTKEAVTIVELSSGPEANDLNSKSEWGQASIPKLGVTMPMDKRPAQHTPEQFIHTNPQYSKYLSHISTNSNRRGRQKHSIPWNEQATSTDMEERTSIT